jgi:hypothetical protein
MLDLNSQHIDQIRNYFLAVSEEEKLSVQNNITPMFLIGFLKDLKTLFILEPDNETKLISVAKSMGASKHIEALKEIQQQFYCQLAEIYLSGNTNSDIDKLLEVNNQSFLNEIAFQKELQTSFVLNERESLKKKFIDLDNANDISPSEMEDAFMQIERERLKEHFKEIDSSINDGTIQDNYMAAEPSDNYYYGSKKTDISTSTSVIKLNWKKLTIAASMVGLVLISSLLIINKNKSTNEIAKSDHKKGAIINKVDSNLPNKDFENKAKELLANNKLKYKKVQIRLLKSESLGFSTKEEKINILFFDTKERIAELEKITKTPVGAGGNNSYEMAIKNQIDSLQSLNNKYTFDGKTVALYIPNTIKVETFKLKDKYFIKIDEKVYSIIKSIKPTIFNKVTDKNVLEKIDKVDFKQNN